MPFPELIFINDRGDHVEVIPQNYPDGFPVANNYAEEVLMYGAGHTMLVARPTSVDMLMKALWFADSARWRGCHIDTLIIPYLPGARQDRMNDVGDFLFAAKSIANEINARKFNTVICFDPHSDVMPALIDNCHVIRVDGIGLKFSGCYDGVVAPDAGAAKRAEAIAKTISVPVINAWKTRNIADGHSTITGFGIEPINGVQKLLIVDDICDGGGTFIGLADHIKTFGQSYEIEVDLYVSHGLFTKGQADLFDRFNNIITTDSTDPRHHAVLDVEVIPVVEKLIEEGHELV
jgi:ribose-phosphate pyrophosphokinase